MGRDCLLLRPLPALIAEALNELQAHIRAHSTRVPHLCRCPMAAGGQQTPEYIPRLEQRFAPEPIQICLPHRLG
jgi:hypothetical protein